VRHARVRIPLRWTGPDEAELDLLDHRDVPWIAELVDLVRSCTGRPWREVHALADGKWRTPVIAALERACAEAETSPGRPTTSVAGGATAVAPAVVRAMLFAVPACDPVERARCVGAVAAAHGVAAGAIEALAWADVPSEAIVALPPAADTPSPRALATAANIAMLQEVFAHAREIRITRDDVPGPAPRTHPGPRTGGSPRAARSLAAELITFTRFRLEAFCQLRKRGRETTIHVCSPPEAITLAG
jgi:hypothetical protein